MKNTIADLRNHLFETIEALKDEEKPMDVERAKQVCNVARALIDSAKVEVKYLELTGQQTGTAFFPAPTPIEKKLRLANAYLKDGTQ
jgi:hypothetical protein